MRCYEKEQSMNYAVGAKAVCVSHVWLPGYDEQESGYKGLCSCSVLLVVQHSNHACSTGRPDLLPALVLFAGGICRRPLGCSSSGEACKHTGSSSLALRSTASCQSIPRFCCSHIARDHPLVYTAHYLAGTAAGNAERTDTSNSGNTLRFPIWQTDLCLTRATWFSSSYSGPV